MCVCVSTWRHMGNFVHMCAYMPVLRCEVRGQPQVSFFRSHHLFFLFRVTDGSLFENLLYQFSVSYQLGEKKPSQASRTFIQALPSGSLSTSYCIIVDASLAIYASWRELIARSCWAFLTWFLLFLDYYVHKRYASGGLLKFDYMSRFSFDCPCLSSLL